MFEDIENFCFAWKTNIRISFESLKQIECNFFLQILGFLANFFLPKIKLEFELLF